MTAPSTHDFVVNEVLSAAQLRNSVNAPINYLAGRELGTDDEVEIEDSMAIQDGSGDNYWGIPAGTTAQRPTGLGSKVGMRWNRTLGNVEIWDGSSWRGFQAQTSFLQSGEQELAAPGILIVGRTTDKFYRHNGTAWDSGTDVPAAETQPQGITVDFANGDVLIVGRTTDKFYRHNGTAWDSGTDVPAAETQPQGITVDSANGDVLIVGQGTGKFYRHNGTAWDSGTDVPAAETSPAGITVDSANGDVLITGFSTDKFYRHNGTAWDSGTDVPAAENTPTGITVDPANGDVLIVGEGTGKFYRHNGTAWDSGTDVPAAETTPTGITIIAATNQTVITGTLNRDGVLIVEVVSYQADAFPTVTVTVDGATVTPDNTQVNNAGDVRLSSYRVAADSGDAYEVQGRANGGTTADVIAKAVLATGLGF